MHVTEFPSSVYAREYANAYAKQRSLMYPGQRKEFFGDPDFWMHQKKEWTEIQQHGSDPLTRPGNSRSTHPFWGKSGP